MLSKHKVWVIEYKKSRQTYGLTARHQNEELVPRRQRLYHPFMTFSSLIEQA